MANKKKTLAVIGLCSFVIGSASFIFINNGKKILKSFANTPYSCQLPDDYVEIHEVLEETVSYAANEAITNPYTFRGTVTKRVGDFCFVQRVNQNDYYLDAIKIKGLNAYADEVVEGNVIDIIGGNLLLENYTPTVILTNKNQHVVSYQTNPYGYAPREYGSITDSDHNSFDNSFSYTDIRSLCVGSSRYIKINRSKIELYDETDTINLGSEEYCYGLIRDPSDSQMAYHFVFTSDIYDSILEKVEQAIVNDCLINIKGISYLHNNYVILINSADDIELTEERTIDTTTVEEVLGSKFTWDTSEDSGLYFSLYHLKGKADVPYVEVGEFINDLCYVLGNDAKVTSKYTDEGDVYYYNDYGRYFIDDENDEILAVNYDGLFAFNATRNDNGYRYLNDYYGSNVEFDDDYSMDISIHDDGRTYRRINTYDLGAYGLDIVKDRLNNCYVPLTPMMNIIIGNTNSYDFVFNGRDVFWYPSMFNEYGTTDVYDLFISSSPFVGEDSRTAEFAQYNYGALCFSLKYCYGLIDDRGASDVDALFVDLGLKDDLLSTDCLTYETAIAEFCGEWLYEGHAQHMGFSPFGYTYNNESGGALDQIRTTYQNNNERYRQLIDTRSELRTQRNAAEKEVGVRFYEDIAIITFDQFVKYRKNTPIDVDLYEYEDLHAMGTDLLFKKAFKEITARDDINNIVIDLSINGGGEISVIPTLLAYMTAHPSIVVDYRMDDETTKIGFKVDLDEDGEYFGENDTYEGKYNFYCLDSRFSFSCGNYLPSLLKANGWATLIGERSGGGICSVSAFSTASGNLFRSSSNTRLGFYDSVNDCFGAFEDGAEADYPFARANFYNDEAIYNFIHSLSV